MVVITDRDDGTRRVQIFFPADDDDARSRTQQGPAKAQDINVIMQRYRKTGILGDPLSTRRARYDDFASTGDFLSVMIRVRRLQERFLALPAEIRARFGNDPAQLIDFVNDPANFEEAVALHLVERPEVPPVPPVAPAPPVGPVEPPR